MNRKYSIILFLCCAVLAFPAVYARADSAAPVESAEAIRVWHATDGLPSDSVTAIVQTHDGFLWIGTAAGLAWFDGVNFTELKLPGTVPNSPVGVTALSEDSNGHLWIGTQQNGLFELAQGTVRQFTTAEGLLDDNVTSLAADNQGQVWIGSKSGLNLWNGAHFQSFTMRDGLPDEAVSGVSVARSGTVWITTRVGMSRFLNGRIVPYEFQTESQGRSPEYLGAYEDRKGNLWAFGDTYLINLAAGKRFNYFRSSESASVRIWSLCEGRDGRLWIGTSGRGLFCFEDDRFQPVILDEERWPYDVRAICEDNEGNLWLGTSGGGLVQLRPQAVHILRAGEGLPSSLPTALALDTNGRIYVGLQRGGLYVGELGRFDRLSGNSGSTVENFISSVCINRDGMVWAGTLGDGLYGLQNGRVIHFTTENGLADNDVLAVGTDSENNLWASTGAGTLHRFDGKNLIRFDVASNPVTTLIPSAAGGIWLGTAGGKILRESKGKFSTLPLPDISGQHAVLALHEDEAGQLWAGTDGGGLVLLANGTGLNWNTSNGLPNNIVAGVVFDDAGNLWLATGAGIFRVNHDDLRKSLDNVKVPLACQLMSEVKTLPETGTVYGGTRALLSPGGGLWFATAEGVLNVDTHQSEIAPSTFPVYLTGASFNGAAPLPLLRGKLWTPIETNGLSFQTPVDSLEVYFTALSFTAPEKIQFRHKLDGLDSGWVNDGNNRAARYGRLPYGSYHFHVEARNADGSWQSAAQTFTLMVPTPLYFQDWAIALYVFLAVALITAIVRVVSHRRLRTALARLEQQQSLERERMRIARDMHDEMGSKLTKISFLSEHAQVEADAAGPLGKKIESIARTSRELLKTMDEIVWVVNPRNDTLENLTTYLSHYAIEYFQNTSVECELRLPPEIPHHPLSSETRHNLFLTFEEALNNVLKHSGATKVKVEINVKEPDFELAVTDNGKGFDVPAPAAAIPARSGRGGNGLKNMPQRLSAVGGECLITSQPGRGTRVAMRLRLNK